MEILIKKAIKGDSEAFIHLMEINEISLYKTAKAILTNEEDIGDAIQETILAAYRNINTLKNPKYFKTWLIRILINNCNDIIKANKKIVLLEEHIETGTCDPTNTQLEVHSCMESLSKEQQTILDLYYHQGFNTREIAHLLGENENTVKSRLTRARNLFKKIFLKSEKGGIYNE